MAHDRFDSIDGRFVFAWPNNNRHPNSRVKEPIKQIPANQSRGTGKQMISRVFGTFLLHLRNPFSNNLEHLRMVGIMGENRDIVKLCYLRYLGDLGKQRQCGPLP